jgi:hypothetical protein
VRASDVEDAIFLAQQIKKHAPDTILITNWADLLYLRPDDNSDLRGMLIFSTYPLFTMNQLWSSDPTDSLENRIQFPFDEAEGEYNATLALLEPPDQSREHQPDDKNSNLAEIPTLSICTAIVVEQLWNSRSFDLISLPFDNFGTEFKPSNQLPLLEYGSPFHEVPGSPGLWIDLVGRDSLWPIGYRPLTPTLDNCSYIDQLEPAPRLVSNSNEPSGTQFGSADEPPTNYHLMLERTRGLFNGAFLILLVVLGAACILFSIVIADDSPVHSPDPKKLSESPPYKTPANDSVSNLVPTNNATELPATAPEENSRVNAKSGSTEKGATDATAKPVTQERPEIALIGTSLTPNPTKEMTNFHGPVNPPILVRAASQH